MAGSGSGAPGPDVEQALQVDRELHDLLGSHSRAVVVEDHAGLDVQRVVEEAAVVAEPRAVVDVLRGGVERLSGVEPLGGVGWPGFRGLDAAAEGVGVLPPDATLGRMLAEAQTYLGRAPWYALFVGLAIVLLILGLSLLTEGLQQKRRS